MADRGTAAPSGAAQRRRARRLRQFLRHEKLSVEMYLAAALHHSYDRYGVDASTQTDDAVPAATCAATAAPAPVFECVAPSQQLPPVYTTATVDTDVNLDITGLVNPHFSSSAVETSAPQVIGLLNPFEEFDAPVYNQVNQEQILTACSRAPVFEYAAPAPVTEYIAPAPAVTSDAFSQQLPPVCTTTTVTTDDNLVSVWCTRNFSSTAVDPSSPHVVGSLPPLEEFTEPVYNQVHQELCVTREITLNIVEHPPVQEPVTVQEIPEVSVVERIQEPCSFTGLMNPQISTTSVEASQVVDSLPPV